MTHRIPMKKQGPFQDIFKSITAEVADMGIIVDGRPAGVEADVAWGDGNELLQAASEGIVECQCHYESMGWGWVGGCGGGRQPWRGGGGSA